MLLSARSLTRIYGAAGADIAALVNVSFEVAAGEIVAIMGPSGSGKSTLMNLIGLLDTATSGVLTLAGKSIAALSSDQIAALRNRHIGFVFQSYNLLARHTTLENVELPLIYSAVARRTRRLKAAAALDRVGMSHRIHHWPSQLSGGEQQRVAIARALVADPALILADEPTGALDSRTGTELLALFQALNREGRTIVMVTHDDFVARHAQRIIRLQDGRVASDLPVAQPLTAGMPRQADVGSFSAPRDPRP